MAFCKSMMAFVVTVKLAKMMLEKKMPITVPGAMPMSIVIKFGKLFMLSIKKSKVLKMIIILVFSIQVAVCCSSKLNTLLAIIALAIIKATMIDSTGTRGM